MCNALKIYRLSLYPSTVPTRQHIFLLKHTKVPAIFKTQPYSYFYAYLHTVPAFWNSFSYHFCFPKAELSLGITFKAPYLAVHHSIYNVYGNCLINYLFSLQDVTFLKAKNASCLALYSRHLAKYLAYHRYQINVELFQNGRMKNERKAFILGNMSL